MGNRSRLSSRKNTFIETKFDENTMGFFLCSENICDEKGSLKKRFMKNRNNSYEINDCRKYFFCFQTHSILIVLFILRKICKPNEKLIMSMHYRLETVKNDINLPDFFF